MFNDDGPFNITVKHYPDPVFSESDKIVRKCIVGMSDAELSQSIDSLSAEFQKSRALNRYFFLHEAVHLYLTVIFSCRNNSVALEKIDALLRAANMDYVIYSESRIFLRFEMLSMLMLCCLKKSDEDLCKSIIDRWIDICMSEECSFVLRQDKASFMLHPLYPLMITESYSLIAYYINRSAEKRLEKNENAYDVRSYSGYVESAVCHRQKKFLKLLCESGYDISADKYCIAYILSDRANAEFISDLWEVRYNRSRFLKLTPLSEQPVLDAGCVDAVIQKRSLELPGFAMISLLDITYKYYGDSGCSELFGALPPIDTIYENDISSVLSDNCFFIVNNEETRKTEEAIRKYTAESITLVVQSGQDIFEMKKYLKNKNITYDLVACSDILEYCGNFGTCEDIRTLVRFFAHENVIFNTEKLTRPVRNMLFRNSSALTKVLVRRGAFSEKNIGEAIDFIVDNKLYNSLDQINKFYFQED
ncbi:MAG: hypothetical protein ACI4XF_04470 [Oscillospiraceae bacterium]